MKYQLAASTIKNGFLFTCAIVFMAACGGGGGSSSNDQDITEDDPGNTTTPTTLRLTELAPNSQSNLAVEIESLDLNSDGHQDLVISRISDSYFHYRLIEAYINNGDETFTNETNKFFGHVNEFQATSNPDYESSGRWVEKFYLSDLDMDGRVDLIPHHDYFRTFESRLAPGPNRFNEDLKILPPLLAQPDGSFMPMDWDDLPTLGLLVPIDADGDQDIDLLVHRLVDPTAGGAVQFRWALLCNGAADTGNFTFELCDADIPLLARDDHPWFIYSPTVIDANSDGHLDLVYSGPRFENDSFVNEVAAIVALTNTGTNSFIDDDTVLHMPPSLIHAREIGAADLNGDQLNDIVFTGHGYDSGGFEGEFNDFMLSAPTSGQLNGDTGSKAPFYYRGFTHASDMADIDNDGDIDIVFADITGADTDTRDLLYFLRNNGNAEFETVAIPYETQDGSLPFITAIKLVDLNNDSYVDLVLGGNDNKHPVTVIWNTGTSSGF